MKKMLVSLAALVLVVICAANARAAGLETGGEYRARLWSLENYLRDGATTEFWDQRLRLGATWNLTPTVRVQLRADILEGLWGENSATTTTAVETTATGEKKAVTVTSGAAGVPISFDWVNLQFVLPGTPLQVTAGRQDVSWGTGFWVAADNRDRFQVAAKLDPVVIVVAYDKFTEVFAGHDPLDDQRGWAIGGVVDAAGFRFGLLGAYLKDDSRIRFPLGDLEYVAGDAFAKGAIGPAKVQLEVTVGGGTVDRGSLGDIDMSGLGAYGGVFVALAPAVTIGLEGAYARGDDPATPAKNEGLFSADYQGPYWSVLFYNNMDYPGYASDAQTSSTNLDFSVRNAATGKLSVVLTPAKGLTLTGAGLYAAADQVKAGADKALGWEFDLIAAYSVTDNVSVTAGVGYALLGGYWKSAPIAGAGGEKPGNPLGAMLAFATRF
jgi:hypothetical protein